MFKEKFPHSEDNLEQKEKEAIKLEKLLDEIGLKLKKEGAPVGFDCRINMEDYSSVYSSEKILKDANRAEAIGNFHNKDRLKTDGERFESLKTIMFNKSMGDGAIVARSSTYDDAKNGVDNVIMDKETGGIICAFDEVASTKQDPVQEKTKKIKDKNKRGGITLDYGMYKEDEKIKLGRVNGIPILRLVISKPILDRLIKQLPSSLEESSEEEKKLFGYFCDDIRQQAGSLLLNNRITRQQKDLIYKLFPEKETLGK